jgi:small subunit ribosomal protein S8e
MGITRSNFHKRRATGGRVTVWRSKRKYEIARPPASTKIGHSRIHEVRTRGGNKKFRALRLDTGNFSWSSESQARKTRILNVAYHPSNNEFVRTNTVVKGSVIQIDATPFRQWYEQHYGVNLGKAKDESTETTKQSGHVKAKMEGRRKTRTIDDKVAEQFNQGRLLAVITSRPGQSGRADGYILEGPELEFYQRKIHHKR